VLQQRRRENAAAVAATTVWGTFAGYRAEKDDGGVQLNPSIRDRPKAEEVRLKTKRPSPTSCFHHVKEIEQAEVAY
jgi:hypothetical protein